MRLIHALRPRACLGVEIGDQARHLVMNQCREPDERLDCLGSARQLRDPDPQLGPFLTGLFDLHELTPDAGKDRRGDELTNAMSAWVDNEPFPVAIFTDIVRFGGPRLGAECRPSLSREARVCSSSRLGISF